MFDVKSVSINVATALLYTAPPSAEAVLVVKFEFVNVTVLSVQCPAD